jgi:hypothetical protein
VSGVNGSTSMPQVVRIDAVQVPGEGAAREAAVEHRLHGRAQARGVLGRDQVDGRPHQRHPHHPALDQRGRQRVRPEAGHAAPQPDIGRVGGLGQEAHQVFERVLYGKRAALQQQLARQRGPVERPPADPVGAERGHR